MKAKIAFLFLIVLLFPNFAYSETSSSSINWLSLRAADLRYCMLYGICIVNELITENLTVRGDFANYTVNNYNITGLLTADEITVGNITINNNACFGANCISGWSEVNTTTEADPIYTAENETIIKSYNTSWVTNNQDYWNDTDAQFSEILMPSANEIHFRDSGQKIYSSAASTLDISSLILYLHFAVIGFNNPYATAIGITMKTTVTDGTLSFYGGGGQDYFSFADDAMLASGESLYFKDKAVNFTSSTSGTLDIKTQNIDIEGDTTFNDEAEGTLVYLCGCGTNTASFSTGYLKFYNGMLMTGARGCVMPSEGSVAKVAGGGYISLATSPAEARFEARVNSNTALSCAIYATEGTGEHNCTGVQARGNYTFIAGDALTCYTAENVGVGGNIDVDYPRMAIWGYLND